MARRSDRHASQGQEEQSKQGCEHTRTLEKEAVALYLCWQGSMSSLGNSMQRPCQPTPDRSRVVDGAACRGAACRGAANVLTAAGAVVSAGAVSFAMGADVAAAPCEVLP